jgi:hypothetical protein
MTIITFEQFEEKYKPVQNHLDENANHDGMIYETFGEELEYIKNIYENGNKFTIWTYIDDGEISWYESGFHLCNRLGYIITEIPFNEGENIIACDEYDVDNFIES